MINIEGVTNAISIARLEKVFAKTQISQKLTKFVYFILDKVKKLFQTSIFPPLRWVVNFIVFCPILRGKSPFFVSVFSVCVVCIFSVLYVLVFSVLSVFLCCLFCLFLSVFWNIVSNINLFSSAVVSLLYFALVQYWGENIPLLYKAK